MVGIVVQESSLLKRRIALQKLFRPLAKSTHVEVFVRSGPLRWLIGLGRDTFGADARGARHASKLSHIFLNYFEVWGAEAQGVFGLEKAYLHLDAIRPDLTGDDEVLALHCDPTITKADPSFAYKRGPHFHISGRRPDISKAHIALCLTDLDRTCSDLQGLSGALGAIVEMIDHELFNRLA